MILLEYPYVLIYVQLYLQNGLMIQLCYVLKFVIKTKDYMVKILLELVLVLVPKILQILTILMLIMVQEDVYRIVLKEHFLIINSVFVGIILKIVHMDGEMIIIIVVQIYVLVQILGIVLVIILHTYVQLDVVKDHMLIIIQELEYVFRLVLEVMIV